MRSRAISRTRGVFERILILCEGETEELYFKEIRNALPRTKKQGLTIDVSRSKNSDPVSIVDEAVRRKKSAKTEGAPYKKIWVVFDHDNVPKRAEAIAKALSNGIDVAYSSINIEVWFIFHFEYRIAPFANGSAAKTYFESKYMKNYKPGTTRVYDNVKNYTQTAIDNAEKLKKHHISISANVNQIHNLNPYLTIDVLVSYLINL